MGEKEQAFRNMMEMAWESVGSNENLEYTMERTICLWQEGRMYDDDKDAVLRFIDSCWS